MANAETVIVNAFTGVALRAFFERMQPPEF
jgi:hypothetical protein